MLSASGTAPVQLEQTNGRRAMTKNDHDGDEKGFAKLKYHGRRGKKPPMKSATLPKGQKPTQDFRGRKDNGNGTVSYT